MKIVRTESVKDTEAVGYSLGKTIGYGAVVALFGDLGAGKTAFTRGFARGMGIESDVSSPTFALVNEYHTNGKSLYHFDMYRISTWDDLYSTGYFDYLDSGATLIIEWSENIESVLPDDCIHVIIKKCDNPDFRILEITGCDDVEIIGN